MKTISLLISPEAKGAFFAEFVDCALQELGCCVPELAPQHVVVGALNFLKLQVEEVDLERLSRLSFVQGVFEVEGSQLTPLAVTPDFKLHDSFIFGSKFKGKTNERFTQMMLNVGLASIGKRNNIKILDPMCGRATTLLWSLRYGFNSKGIEVDPRALADIQQIVKKWSKVTRISAKLKEGFVAKKTRSEVGKFLELHSQDHNFKAIVGDSSDAATLLKRERFDLIVTDVPYGVQHPSHKGAKNPVATLEQCLPAWSNCLAKGGAMVIGFNSNNPRRKKLVGLAEGLGLATLDFEIPHRMSESIVRDVVVLKQQAGA